MSSLVDLLDKAGETIYKGPLLAAKHTILKIGSSSVKEHLLSSAPDRLFVRLR
jgi:hypothetical protein